MFFNHCYFSDCSRVNKEFNEICGQLEQVFSEYRASADAHIYMNLSDSENGWGIHWDTSHNLIVQMEGETKFEVWDEGVMGARNMPYLSEKPVIEEVLQPGDAIFVPIRVYHRATSLMKRMSVSFPISFGDTTSPQERHWIKIT